MKQRFLWIFISLCIVLLSLPIVAMGAIEDSSGQIISVGGKNPAEGLHPDRVAVEKTVSPNEAENYFDITLRVQTETKLEQLCTMDVVMVLDISRSMHDNYVTGTTTTRLEMAKKNAIAFLDEFLGLDSQIGGTRRLALVAYDSDAETKIPWVTNQAYQDDAGRESLKKTINALQARKSVAEGETAAVANKRFTNIEGGLQLAKNLLAESVAKSKYVILLTDGFPTTYIQSGHSSKTLIEGYDTLMGSYTGSATYDLDGYFSNPRISGSAAAPVSCLGGTNYSDKGALRAEAVAKSLKTEGVQIFSVGISEPKDFTPYLDQYNNNPSPWTCTIDCFMGDGKTDGEYVIGSADGNKTASPYRDTMLEMTDFQRWLGGTSADDKMVSGSARGIGNGYSDYYLDGSDEAAMEIARKRIVQSMIETNQALCAALWNVNDPMGENIAFLGFYDKGGNLKDVLSGANKRESENTADFETTESRIHWMLMRSGYETGTTPAGTTLYTYSLRYRVRLKNEKAGFLPGNPEYTNGVTVLTYTPLTEGADPEEKTLPFPIPQVKGYHGTLLFRKEDARAGHVPGAGFALSHDPKCSVCGGIVSIPVLNAVSDAQGQVSMERIPSGHDYLLEETAVPQGYLPPNRNWKVVVSYGNTVLYDGDQRIQSIVNTAMATPTPTFTPIVTPAVTPSATPSAAPTATPTFTPGPTLTPTITPLQQIPQTGDGSNLRLLISMLLLSLLGAGATAIFDQYQNKNSH